MLNLRSTTSSSSSSSQQRNTAAPRLGSQPSRAVFAAAHGPRKSSLLERLIVQAGAPLVAPVAAAAAPAAAAPAPSSSTRRAAAAAAMRGASVSAAAATQQQAATAREDPTHVRCVAALCVLCAGLSPQESCVQGLVGSNATSIRSASPLHQRAFPPLPPNQLEIKTRRSAAGLPRTAVVGVLGGGQLGRMMALAAANLGVTVRCLDPTDDAPAAIIADHVVGHFRDAAAIADFAKGCDVLTVEIEHIDADALEAAAAAAGVDAEPTPATVRVIQDKYAQKRHFDAAGVPVADYADAPDAAALEAAAARYGFPLMLKSKRLAYDGRGNFVVRSRDDLLRGAEALGGFGHGLYAERWAPFVKELAVMVVRSRDGSVLSYPVVETIHRDNICHVTEAPADVAPAVAEAARAAAERAVAALDGAGIFGCVETNSSGNGGSSSSNGVELELGAAFALLPILLTRKHLHHHHHPPPPPPTLPSSSAAASSRRPNHAGSSTS